MENRKLAFVGLEADTTSACLSMLKIMNGRSSVEWMQAEPEDADVLMVANEDSAACQQWQESNKPCIVIYHNNEQKPSAPYTLSHPFRVMQLINILEDVSATLGGSQQDSAKVAPSETPVPNPATAGQENDFSASLYQAVTGKNKEALYQAQSAKGSLFVSPSAGAYFIQEPLFNEVRHKTVALSALKPAANTDLSAYIRRPIAELAWMTAQLASTLPEWLPKDGNFRLKRWPNVRSAKNNRAYLSMSALMTKQPCRREQLAAHAGCEQQQVDRFLSACAMSDLLVCEAGTAAPTRSPMSDEPRRLGSFIQGLRHRLGLSS
ncbi:hypothetical protein Y5S_00107 [Alcanivorax nanhaiticus]|uniref:Uncharacterized protein n=1 Tax=Alcanivorax nanhaiticus TaxID=1177154 RepID=A0A095UV61_9GAMM|nr:hypothetical protein [Alcanivorax nanhaiticus]KGD66440.1 hypothetical protein Y5S_00107 [Alcanivorax nanhaiticus]